MTAIESVTAISALPTRDLGDWARAADVTRAVCAHLRGGVGRLVKEASFAKKTLGSGAARDVATDSRGNIYTTETCEGKRLQKFVLKGVARVPAAQGLPWPRP